MKQIHFHADDYAISPNSSENILDCLEKGVLDSISILTNMSCYKDYANKYLENLNNWKKKPLLTIHLNFMEGHCLSDPTLVPHLVDKRGLFNISWGQLLIWNYSPHIFLQIKNELKLEIKAQTLRFREVFGMEFGKEFPLRFDGHQHTQMIPIVYHSLLEVILEEQLNVNYIRITKEPILPFLKKLSFWKTYKPINWIKNILLNAYAPRMERLIARNIPNWQSQNAPMFLWGVLMSGQMDSTRVESLLPNMCSFSTRKGRNLEILFHPGTVLESELTEEFNNLDANLFHTSAGRHIEYDTLMKFPAE